LLAVPVAWLATPITPPPPCDNSFSFRLALFVLFFVENRPASALSEAAELVAIDEFAEELHLRVPLVVPTIDITSKMEDQIFGIGVNLFGFCTGGREP